MSRSRGGLFVGLAALIGADIVIIGAGATSTPKRAKSKFTKNDRTLLAKKAREGATSVSLLIATPRHGTKSVASSIRKLGGKVHKVLDVPNVGRMAIIEDPTGAMIATFRMKN